VRIIKRSRVLQFGKNFPDASESLRTWVKVVGHSDWRNLIEVRSVYPSADPVKVHSGRTVVVFNIGGNKYRLVVAMHFNTTKVYVLRFLTHAEYNKENWKWQL
jgi:mRNA interferase HigB